jgi:deoxycytidine triphosphate deaminase
VPESIGLKKMVLSHAEIQKIVQNLSQRELENPEGHGVDLRLGEVHKIAGGQAFIEADTKDSLGKRSGFDTEVVMEFNESQQEQDKLTVKPGEYYLVKTIESVDMPSDVLGDFRPRSSLFRAGLALLTSVAPSGYKGGLVFGLYNAGPLPVTLQMGARVAHAVFYRTEAEGIAYRGQNQGGRVTAAGTEQQV